MEKTRHKALLIVIGLVCLSIWTSATMKDVMILEDPAVKDTLPDRVGDYDGLPIYYCQADTCRGLVVSLEPKESLVCPICKGVVDTMAPAERRALPADTQIIKKRYWKPGEPSIQVAMVISGKDRLSLHRPQNCLPGQGYTIVGSKEATVPAESQNVALPLNILDLERRMMGAPPTVRPEQSCYAYSYLAGDRRTSSQFQMMIWMAWDRVRHNLSHRWTYLSIASDRAREMAGHDEERLAAFAEKLYPLIVARPVPATIEE